MTFAFTDEFENLDYAKWLEIVGHDLKLEDVEKKLNSKSLEGVSFSPLSTNSKSIYLKSYPKSRVFYKGLSLAKAGDELRKSIQENLDGGINNFLVQVDKELPKDLSFLEMDAQVIIQLNNPNYVEQCLDRLNAIFNCANNKRISIVISEFAQTSHSNLEISNLVDATKIHNAGASMVQELAYILSTGHQLLINSLKSKKELKIQFHVACDSMFFGNVAKLRALRFMWERLQEEYQTTCDFEIVTTSSLREQTLYDPWVNILRNVTSSFAAMLGGADRISCLAYDGLFEQLTNSQRDQLGDRIARNSMHILSQESHLDAVKDPLAGSYSVENLTIQLIEGAWQLFLDWEKNNGVMNRLEEFAKEVSAIALCRFEHIRNRKHILTGINNFANPQESIQSLYQQKTVYEKEFGQFPVRRHAREFEQLRMDYELKEKNLLAYVACYGDPAKLSARINFAKNYFELLGMEVKESSGKNLSHKDHLAQMGEARVIILCAQDDDYQEIVAGAKLEFEPKKMFLAGKFNDSSIPAIHQGQDVYHILAKLVEEL